MKNRVAVNQDSVGGVKKIKTWFGLLDGDEHSTLTWRCLMVGV